MFGTLRKVKITDALVEEVAREEFMRCNDGEWEWENVGGCARAEWLKGAEDGLDDFNDMIKVFKKIGIECSVDNTGCGWDVEEYYRE